MHVGWQFDWANQTPSHKDNPPWKTRFVSLKDTTLDLNVFITQTQGGGPKMFIKQSLPAKIFCSFDWWFQYRRFGETNDWKPSVIILYSKCGSFRLSSSSRKDTEKLNSGDLSSKKKKGLLKF